MDILKRFEKKFSKSDGCWEWSAGKCSGGYGTFLFGKKTSAAHRISYSLYVGEIPKGLWVLHKCDNRKCVNPNHLFLGTHQDNMDDMISKGRDNKARGDKVGARTHPEKVLRGENHGSAKITEAQAIGILRDPRSLSKIAKDYGVGKPLVWKIKTRRLWKCIDARQ